jgi:hypothetical protein
MFSEKPTPPIRLAALVLPIRFAFVPVNPAFMPHHKIYLPAIRARENFPGVLP